MQVSTVRASNRYADAYLEPEYNALAQLNSNNVTPWSHFPDVNNLYATIADPYRGATPGGNARPGDYETPVFWSVYVLSGYEETYSFDYDGETDEFGTMENAHLGSTDSRNQNLVEGEVSAVFTETIRDAAATTGTLSEAEVRARTITHEVGHQFGLVAGAGGPHRDDPPNIMSSVTSQVPTDLFYFHPADIVYLRSRIQSPGLPPS